MDLPLADGLTNMALDEELLARAESGIAGYRIYGWAGPWVSLGRYQDPVEALAPGWDWWVSRPTGGLAVLHGHDITVAVAAPMSSGGAESKSVKRVYRTLVQPIVSALKECGIKAELGERTAHITRATGSPDCFLTKSANDVINLETGQKLCGCALRIRGAGVLLQASIPYRSPLVDPSSAIQGAGSGRHWELDPGKLVEHLAQAFAIRNG